MDKLVEFIPVELVKEPGPNISGMGSLKLGQFRDPFAGKHSEQTPTVISAGLTSKQTRTLKSVDLIG